MSTNIKYDYYVHYPMKNNEIFIISSRHPHLSISKLTKNHLKYVFIHKMSFKSEVFLSVHHETSHTDLHNLKIQFKVEYCPKNLGGSKKHLIFFLKIEITLKFTL